MSRLTSLREQAKKFSLSQFLPLYAKETLFLRIFGLTQVPVLFLISPTVEELTPERCVVRVPLNRRTKNHLKSMYFGVLAAGADCAGGLMAMKLIQDRAKGRVSLIFKDFQAQFLRRAEGDVLFTCEDGRAIEELVNRTIETGERQNLSVKVVATVPTLLGQEPVAEFRLTLSLKKLKK